jgi:hypothetical protein
MSANVFKHEFEQRAFVSSAYKTKERMFSNFQYHLIILEIGVVQVLNIMGLQS